MKTNENQKSTNHSTTAQKPFFGAGTEHAFFSAERAPSTPFFQPKAVSPSALQAKSAISQAEGISQPVVQLLPAFESEINNKEVQRSLFNSPQQLSASPIQAKLTIGEPGDKYEQEADRVASQVVEQINVPASSQSTQGRSVQRQEEQQEELQAKPEITALQRQEEKPEELQAKSTQQRAIAGGEASTDLTSAINSARGGGQPLEAGMQQSMGQAMGADFSGVRVHTDSQSDQLNQSIQAKAFTTGQDVFFRQGAYEPGSRGGQELIAHELTHVVQQSGGTVNISRSHERVIQRFKDKLTDTTHITDDEIKQASKEKLQEWLARESPELISWDDDNDELTPDKEEKDTIKVAIAAIEKADAEEATLKELGVTAEQLLLFQNTTEKAEIIKKCATTCATKTWDLTVVLNSLGVYSEDARKTALCVLAKGDVTTTKALISLASNWENMKDKSTINVQILINLIKDKAVSVKGGPYKVPKLTGTQDTAYTFYFNAIPETTLRIKPEWHVHVTGKEFKRPGFKNQGDKYNIGPGTRVETNEKDSQELLTACQQS